MVTGRPAPDPAPGGSGLLARLTAVVRPEFRVDILVPEPGALIFNTEPCRVPGCERMPWTRKLCRGHYYRWKQEGRPDMEAFVASAVPDLLGRKELTECVVTGCRFGGARRGLCVSHHGFWERAGEPDRPAWLASLPAVHDEGRAVCLLSFCTLWRQGNSPFCVNHKSRWEFVGRPDLDEFIVICESKGDDRFDFRPLAASSSWNCSTRCSAATTSGRPAPPAGPSAAPSPWPPPAESLPCWTGRPAGGPRSSTNT